MAAPLRASLTGSRRCTSSSWSSTRRSLANYAHSKAQVQSVSKAQVPVTDAGAQEVPEVVVSLLQTPTCSTTRELSTAYFQANRVVWKPLDGKEPTDPNKAKLGKTLRILQDRLPTLLQSPLPQEILAPNISLQLFPSTHPHLPTVSGRVAYNAALWTSPIAWNRVPIIGNVKLEILAERMTSEPLTFLPRRSGAIAEQLVVRWCEKRKTPPPSSPPLSESSSSSPSSPSPSPSSASSSAGSDRYPLASTIARSLRLTGRSRGADPNKAFTGLFIFDFDAEGRILTHTIEQAAAGNNWEKGVGAKVVGLTDWLLGGMRDPGGTPPLPMFERRRRHS